MNLGVSLSEFEFIFDNNKISQPDKANKKPFTRKNSSLEQTSFSLFSKEEVNSTEITEVKI